MANKRITKKPKVARQYEISQNHIEVNSIDQGGLPDMPNEGLQPDTHLNRAKEVSKNDSKSTADFYMGLEAVDEAVFYYFENVIKPSVVSGGDLVDVPVIYGTGERWKMAQKDGFYRDKNGKIQAPLVMVRRETIEKRRDLGNKLDANDPKLYVTYQEKYSSRNQYDNFALLNNRVPQKEFTATVIPDYVNLMYEGIIWTDYISQLNKVIEAINYASDSYWGDEERFKFMAQIDKFTNINELSADNSRVVRATFNLKIQAYILPENIQKKLKNTDTRWYSKSQFVLNSQTTVLEDTEVSKRARFFGGDSTSTTVDVSVSGSAGDDDWDIFDAYIINGVEGARRNVIIDDAFLSVDIGGEKETDIFIIKKEDEVQLKVDNDGILSFKEFNTFPEVVEGGLIFKDDNFYLGF